nr:hypothetical protein [Tanacetum cinerariifolium]
FLSILYAEIVPKDSQRRRLSEKGKCILKDTLEEVETFNTSSICAAFKRLNTASATRKEKRARCYICKVRVHVYWKCPNKKNRNKGETSKANDVEEHVDVDRR